MKVVAWYKDYTKNSKGTPITRIFTSVTAASNCLKIPKKRIKICIETGTSWKGILFDEASDDR